MKSVKFSSDFKREFFGYVYNSYKIFQDIPQRAWDIFAEDIYFEDISLTDVKDQILISETSSYNTCE